MSTHDIGFHGERSRISSYHQIPSLSVPLGCFSSIVCILYTLLVRPMHESSLGKMSQLMRL